jgi:cell wall-associated NlpC family hydrolase/cell division protein FtsB
MAGLGILALVVAPFVVPVHAGAAPKPTIKQVRQRVKELHEQAEVASERYNDLREQIAGLNVRLEAVAVKLAEQKKIVARARAELARVAADTYKAGDLAALELFFSDRPDGYITANGLLLSLDDRKRRAMDDVLAQQQQLVAMMTDAQEQQQRLEKARKDLQATRIEVERKLKEQTSLLGRLSAGERDRLGQLEAGEARRSLEESGIKVPAGHKLACDDVPVVPPNPRAAKALAYACAQLGDPYRWGADGPTSFDCSGLTMMAWKQAGVSLPHSSQLQARHGTKVRVKDLQAGDLVFFYSGLTHVGIYVGKGAMLHAPRTGKHVEIVGLGGRTVVTAVRL